MPIVFESRKEGLYIEVQTPPNARIDFSVAVNGKEFLKSHKTKATVAKLWKPAPTDEVGAVSWSFTIASPKASYHLRIRHVKPGQNPKTAKLVHHAKGESSEGGVEHSVGVLLVILPAN